MIDQKTFARFASSPADFRDALIIDVDGVAKAYGPNMDPWQREDFAAIDPALMRCNGRKSDSAGPMRAYLERPRGHSKTTDLAVTCVWALAFATRPIRGYCYAGDKDQATLLKDAMATIVRLNPWIGEILDVQKGLVVNIAVGHPGKGGSLTIEASDVGSSYGILPDLIIADELTHWEGDGSLWHSLISSAAKRSNCLLVTISNAGFADSWQWHVRETARSSGGWYFSRLDGPQASWMTGPRLDEQRRMLPAIAFARLWLNTWTSGGGDALTEADINAAFRPNLRPMARDEDGWHFVAGVDLGLTRDCSAVVVLAVRPFGKEGVGKIRLAHHRVWKPVLGKKINLTEVERHIANLDELYDLRAVGYDPWQAEHLAQRLETSAQHRRRTRKRSVHKQWMTEIPPTAKNLRAIASTMIESFTDHRIELYPCELLKRDLVKLRVEETSYGFRLSSPRDGDGHGDLASALGHALLVAHGQAGERPMAAGVMVLEGNGELTLMQRALRQMELERELLDEDEDEFFDEDRETLKEIMELLGR